MNAAFAIAFTLAICLAMTGHPGMLMVCSTAAVSGACVGALLAGAVAWKYGCDLEVMCCFGNAGGNMRII